MQIKYRIILDIGSESMFALLVNHEEAKDRYKEVQLQKNCSKWTEESIDRLEVLRDDNGKISNRLLNRIDLVGNRVNACQKKENNIFEIEISNASLDFEKGNYSNSLFNYFPHKNSFINPVCNPKIAFYSSAYKIIPKVKEKKSQEEVLFDPGNLIKHITCQVLNNFIWYSPEVIDARQIEGDSNFLERTEIVLTVPNIYSSSHTKSLIEFVSQNSIFQRISSITESDALLWLPFLEYADLKIDSAFQKRFTENVTKYSKSMLLSIDVGKGTTDMSFASVECPNENSSVGAITINARIGLGKGGNHIDFSFVEYFNQIFLQYLDAKSIEAPYNFMSTAKPNLVELQQTSNYILQEIIFEFKKNIEVGPISRMYFKFKIGYLIERILIPLATIVDIYNQALANNKTYIKINDLDFIEYFLKKILAGFSYIIYSKKLKKIFGYIGSVLDSSNLKTVNDQKSNKPNKNIKKRTLFEKSKKDVFLNKQLKLYLNRNICRHIYEAISELSEGLIKNLRTNFENRAKILNTNDLMFERKFPSSNFFLIVSGQASQFKPLLSELIYSIKNYFPRLNVASGTENILTLKGLDAKKACCYGAAIFYSGGLRVRNEHESLCTYGLKTLSFNQYSSFDYEFFNNGKEIALAEYNNKKPIRPDVDHYLTYSTKIFDDSDVPSIEDGYTSYIKSLRILKTPVLVQYDLNRKLIVINNCEIMLAGYIESSKHLLSTLWPETLENKI